MIDNVRSATNWLVDGLVEAWTAVEDRLRPRARFLLVPAADGHALKRPDGEVVVERLQFGDAAAEVPAESAALLKDADIDVVLLPEELLIRALDPLPAQSKPYLDGIVRHQLERLTPWRVNDVLYNYQALPTGLDDSRLNVIIAATARSLHRQRLEQLGTLQPRSLRLTYHDPVDSRDFTIDVTGGDGSLAQTQHMRRVIGLSAAGFAALCVLTTILLTMVWQRTDARLEETEREIAGLRSKLAASGPATPSGDRDLQAIVNRRLSTPYAVAALDALSSALPDDTSLTEFRVAEGHVRMTGVSRAVSQLVPLLEASSSFADATFFAPTTRLSGNQGDRFHLDARLVPPGAPKP